MDRQAKKAASGGAKCLFLPENFSYLGSSAGAAIPIAEPVDGKLIGMYKALAKEESIWLSLGGFQEKSEQSSSHVFNSHIIIDNDGQLVSKYRKIHLFDYDVNRESSYTLPGDKLVSCPSPFGTLGLSV